MPLRRDGGGTSIKVSIFLKLFYYGVSICLLWHWCLCVVALVFLRAMVKLKGTADCQGD